VGPIDLVGSLERALDAGALNSARLELQRHATPSEIQSAKRVAASLPPHVSMWISRLHDYCFYEKREPEPFVRTMNGDAWSLFSAPVGEPASRELVIGFAGGAANLFQPAAVVLQQLTAEKHDLLLLRDLSQDGYRAGTGDHATFEDGSPGRIVVEGSFTTEGVDLIRLGAGESRFISNDLGRLDPEGVLHHLGRFDDTYKIAGVRVEISAVEAVLRESPGVLNVAVVAVPVSPGEVRFIAHIECASGQSVDIDDLRIRARAFLPGVAVPIRFVVHEEPLPLLPSGKIDRVRLTA